MPKKAQSSIPNQDASPAAATGEKAQKAKSTSKASKAGLLIPVPKINKRMQNSGWTSRVGATAPIWTAAVCEYIARELVEAPHRHGREAVQLGF